MAKILSLILILISISQVYSKSFQKREIDISRRLNHIQPTLQRARREESENGKRRHTFFELGKHVDIENSIKKPPLSDIERFNNDNVNKFRYKRQNNNYNTDYHNLNKVFVNDAYNNNVSNLADYNFQSEKNNIYNNVDYNINTATNNNYKYNNSEYNNYKVPLATVSPNIYHSTSKYLNSHGNNNYKTTTEALYPFGYYIKNNNPNNNYNNATTETYTGDYNWNNLYGSKSNNKNNTYENSVINTSSSIVWDVRSTTDLTNPGVRVVGPSKASVINYQSTTAKVISLSKFFNRNNTKFRRLRRRKTTTGAPKVVSSCIMFCTGSASCPQDKILVGGFCVEDKKDAVEYDYYDVY